MMDSTLNGVEGITPSRRRVYVDERHIAYYYPETDNIVIYEKHGAGAIVINERDLYNMVEVIRDRLHM